jgi:methylenetetrahydrofolate dehydrogenase (NADP+)/methenyltetrahydrofolate cyclohydrolase
MLVSMSAGPRVIDGRAVAEALRGKLKERVGAHARPPSLVIVCVGDDPRSARYIAKKQEFGESIGVSVLVRRVRDAESARIAIVSAASDPAVDGIILQLPIPGGEDPRELIACIPPDKDVDGLTPENQGRLASGSPQIIPATARAVMHLLSTGDVPLASAEALVIGRSALVGMPVCHLLLAAGATVTVAHSRTRDLGQAIARSDVIVSATGAAGLFSAHMCKDGAVVIDVGISVRAGGTLAGDMIAEGLDHLRAYTPVPGGVGPVTVACLFENLCDAYDSGKGR